MSSDSKQPHLVVEPAADHAEDAEHARNFRRNAETLMEQWPRLVEAHRGSWVAIYGDGVVIIDDSPIAIRRRIPENDQHDSLIRHLVDIGVNG